MKPLERHIFRNSVFERDGHKCVFCGVTEGLDAHHILERRLFPDGGYYLKNGATVCSKHHMECETTDISVEEVREACKITKPIIPEHLYEDQKYDKWGNAILGNGTRLRGELFYDQSVQKVLADKLHLFTHHVKYPRTFHCTWSENMSEDDRMHESMDHFEGRTVIVSMKMDGESTSMYRDYIHARSLDSNNHPSRNWVKNFWSSIRAEIPEQFRICGENLYAEHSIPYRDLPTYFMGFSVWNDRNICLSWDETCEYFTLLGITPVQVLYDGIYDEEAIRALYDDRDWDKMEGYVIRDAESFSYGEFSKKVAKFVRGSHIQTVKHWMWGQPIKKNGLKQP